MNIRKLQPLLVIAIALFCTTAFAEPISLDPGSPATATITPLAINDKDNPLHLDASQQLHLNARKLRFQKAATAIFTDSKINSVNKGIKIKALDKEAITDIIGMLNAGQRTQVETAQHAGVAQTQAGIEHAKARQALLTQYVAARTHLMKTISPVQRKTLLQLEKSSQAKIMVIVGDKTLSKDQKNGKIRAIFMTYEHQRDTIYTPDQLAIMQQMVAITRQAQSLK